MVAKRLVGARMTRGVRFGRRDPRCESIGVDRAGRRAAFVGGARAREDARL